MAIDLINEVIDHAPANLTPAERLALVVLAEDARLPSREIWHDITDEYLLARLRLSARSWLNMRGDLVKKKVLEKVEGGHNGKKARYKIPILNEAMKGHPIGDSTAEDGEELGTGIGDPTALKGHPIGESRVTQSVTQTYITPSTPSTTPRKRAEAEVGEAAETHPDAAAIVGSLDLDRTPGSGEYADLIGLISAALAAGWTAPAVTKLLNRDWTGARDRVRTALSRAKGDLGAPPPTPEPQRSRASPTVAPRLDCPHCHGSGFDEDDYGNQIGPCPSCKPSPPERL